MAGFWKLISQISGFIKLYHIYQVLPAIALAGLTAFVAFRDHLTLSVVITLTILTLAAAVVLINQGRTLLGFPIFVQAKNKLRFGISYESIFFAFNPNPVSGGLQLGLNLLNTAGETIKYEVERLDVIVGTTTLSHKIYANKGGILPPGIRRVYRDPLLTIAQIPTLLNGSHVGSLEAHIVYGRPDDKMTRRYKLKLSLTIHLGQPIGVADAVLQEDDEAIP